MFERDDTERTEEATPRKREEARKKGQVPKSRDLSTAILLLSVILFFYLAGDYYLNLFKSTIIYYLSLLGKRYNIFDIILNFMYFMVKFLLPFVIVVFLSLIHI